MQYVKLNNDSSATNSKVTKSDDTSAHASKSSSNQSADSSNLFPDMDSDSRKHFMVIK